jgi:hypothetical protein
MPRGASWKPKPCCSPLEGFEVALADVLHEGGPLVLHGVVEDGTADGARGDAPDGRMQGPDADLGPRQVADDAEGGVNVLGGVLVAGGDHAQDVGQGPDLGRLALEGR